MNGYRKQPSLPLMELIKKKQLSEDANEPTQTTLTENTSEINASSTSVLENNDKKRNDIIDDYSIKTDETKHNTSITYDIQKSPRNCNNKN